MVASVGPNKVLELESSRNYRGGAVREVSRNSHRREEANFFNVGTPWEDFAVEQKM